MDNIPTDIIVLLFKLITGKVAGNDLSSLVRTSRRFRDIAYKHIIRTVFDTRAVKYCCNNVDYYKRVGAVPKQGHLTAAIHSYELVNHMLSIVDDAYLVEEAQNINMYCLHGSIKILLVRRHPIYLEKAWRVVTHSTHCYGFKHIKDLYSIRDHLYQDVRLYDTPLLSYQSIIDAEDYDLAYQCIIENQGDISCYSNAIVNFIIATSQCSLNHELKYPWLCEDHGAVILINRVLQESKFTPEWFLIHSKNFRNEYNVYFSVRYQVPLQRFRFDTDTLIYLLSFKPSHKDLINIIRDDSRHADTIFRHIPFNQFSIHNLIEIAGITLNQKSITKLLFSSLYFEPSVDGWNLESYFDEDIFHLSREYNLDENEIAVVKLYVSDFAREHRSCVEDLLSDLHTGNKTQKFEKWAISRRLEKWSIRANIEKFIEERDNGIREQEEIDLEQKAIQLNWSRDNFTVPEWDDYEIMCTDDIN